MSQAKVGAFEVTEKEISRLAPAELVELLDKLLAAESWAFGLPGRAAQGTFKITIPDGGEDFRIHWSGPPDETDFIPRRFTVFQSKAEKLTLAKIGSVPVTGKGPQAKLHVAIEEAIVRQGGYIRSRATSS
jgi:hypothetical protein